MKLNQRADLLFEMLSEMPWVEVGGKVVDLEVEKHSTDEIRQIIRKKLDKFSPKQRNQFLKNLFGVYPAIMNKLGISPYEVINEPN